MACILASDVLLWMSIIWILNWIRARSCKLWPTPLVGENDQGVLSAFGVPPAPEFVNVTRATSNSFYLIWQPCHFCIRTCWIGVNSAILTNWIQMNPKFSTPFNNGKPLNTRFSRPFSAFRVHQARIFQHRSSLPTCIMHWLQQVCDSLDCLRGYLSPKGYSSNWHK